MSKNSNSKRQWKPGNMLYPLPAVMVSLGDNADRSNIVTVAWTGTVCTNPPMVYISLRPERYSYNIIKETGEFVINLTTKKLAKATDLCGVVSGRDVNKWEKANLTPIPATKIKCPMIAESPVNIECKLVEVKELGSHSMFLAEVVAVNVSEEFIDEKERLNLAATEPIIYSHGEYYSLGELIGTFGYSVRKKTIKKKNKRK